MNRAIKTRRLKKADCEAGFFFIESANHADEILSIKRRLYETLETAMRFIV
jgi:hypothetical protein